MSCLLMVMVTMCIMYLSGIDANYICLVGIICAFIGSCANLIIDKLKKVLKNQEIIDKKLILIAQVMELYIANQDESDESTM